jgi:hypothetical protein
LRWKRRGAKKGENMNKAKSAIKNNLGTFFILFNTLLSITDICTAMAAAKIEQYNNPFIVALPLSNFFWFLFAIFAKVPEEYTEEEIKALYPNAKRPPKAVQLIIKIIMDIIFFMFLAVVLADIAMMLLIALKMAVSPSSFMH